jgi:hypothetical protein
MEYLWECTKCEEYQRVDRPIKDREIPPERCPNCKKPNFERRYEMPGTTKASFLDGTKRKGFQDLKEIARLEVKKGAANSEAERKEASKAIADLKRIKPT